MFILFKHCSAIMLSSFRNESVLLSLAPNNIVDPSFLMFGFSFDRDVPLDTAIAVYSLCVLMNQAKHKT